MAIQSVVHSNAFNFVSFMQNSVDPRTGQYTLGIELPELIGNNLNGPRLPLNLSFSPMNGEDAGFGIGWSLNLSQYAIQTQMLSLATGESFKVADNGPGQTPIIAERKLESFHLHNESDPGTKLVRYRVVHKSGLVEVLEPHPGDLKVALPVRVLAPSGHSLTLTYERIRQKTCLVSVSDDTGRYLLAISYASNSQVLIDLHPGQPAMARYTLERSGDDLTKVVLPSDEQASWRFNYQTYEGVRCVTGVETPLGGVERIHYQAQGHQLPRDAQNRTRYLPRVVRHVVEPRAGQPEMVTLYSYSPENFLGYNGAGVIWSDDGQDNLYKLTDFSYRYSSTAHYMRPGQAGEAAEVEVRSIKRWFNRFHLVTEEATTQGDCVATVSTLYHENPRYDFVYQPNNFQLPREVTRQWRLISDPNEVREEKVLTDFDDFGNLTDETQANGVRTRYEYLADPEGFRSQPRMRRVDPASEADTEPGARVLRTDYTYVLLAPLSPLTRGELLAETETLTQEADGAVLRKTTVTYHQSATQRLTYGRRKLEQVELGGRTTQVQYSYALATDKYPAEIAKELTQIAKQLAKIADHLPVVTVEIITGFDHGQPDELGRPRDTMKTITLVHSALIGEPLLNRDDNDVEIAYEYDRLLRVTQETVAPNQPDYTASRKYTYQLATAAGAAVVQTRTDVKGVLTMTYLDGLGRDVREERQDSDFGLTKSARRALRPSYTAKYDALGNRVEETEYDWLERVDQTLTTTFDYDDWGQQCCVTGPDGVRNYEQSALNGSRAWRSGPVVTQWRESADGKTRTGSTVSLLNRFEEPSKVTRFDIQGREYSTHHYFLDGLGRTAREVEARGEQTKFTRDAFDRLVDHTLADGAVVHRDYAKHSSEDLPTRIEVVHQNASTVSLLGEQRFDGLDRMVESITGGRRRVMVYQPGQRQPHEVITPRNQHIAYEYVPALGEEPMRRSLLDADVTATYDYDRSNARLTSCTEQQRGDGRADEFQGLSREYFSTGELRSERRTLGVDQEEFEMSYVHSLRGRLLAYTDVQGQLQSYEYDGAGRLTFTALGTVSSAFSYDALGRMSKIETVDEATRPANSLVTELEYDEFDREVLRRFIFADDSSQELRQDYNVIDGIVRKELIELSANSVNSELLRLEHFEYDRRARLEYYESEGPLSPQDPSGVTIEAQAFYLDDLDNIEEVRTWHADGRIDARYSFDNPDDPAQLTGVELLTLRKVTPQTPAAPGEEPQLEEVSRRMMPLYYDEDGNMTQDEAGRTLVYDTLGRLVSVKVPGTAEHGTYGYDPLDRLAVQTGEGGLEMNTDEDRVARSEQVRKDVIAQRSGRNRSGPLGPIQIDTTLIADPNDNTLSARYFQTVGQPLRFGIPAWVFAPLGEDKLEIQLSRGGGDFFTEKTLVLPAPQDPATFPYVFELPRQDVDLLGEGVHRFRYKVTDWTGGSATSAELSLRFDLLPPYRTEKPAAFATVANVTDATLAAAGDKVVLDLPPYFDWETGDKVRWYWFNALPEGGVAMQPLGELPVPKDGLALEVPGSHVRKIGDGGSYAWYELEDKAGYVSKMSEHIAIGVALGVLPTVLPPPEVNLATAQDGYLIDTADAALGVEVEVTLAPQVKPTDWINVHWGQSDLGWVPVGPGPRLRSFSVPLSILRSQYFDDPTGAESRTTGDKNTLVVYELMRGSVPLGGGSRDIIVNFETVGPLDPDWPSPINAALLAPTVLGPASQTPNKLSEGDNGKPASLTFTLFEDVGEGDAFTFYWGTELIAGAAYTAGPGDVEGDTVTVEVPWDAIAHGGNGTIRVHYRVTRPGVPNPSNSIAQDVTVDAIVETAAPVTFLGAMAGGLVLACSSLYENPAAPHAKEPAFRIKVPPLNPALAIGTSLTLTWRVLRYIDGSGGAIPEVNFDESITLTDAQIREGFIWYVPWDRYIQPIYGVSQDGVATVQYSYMSGKLVTSQAASIMVSPRDPGGICPIPPNTSALGESEM